MNVAPIRQLSDDQTFVFPNHLWVRRLASFNDVFRLIRSDFVRRKMSDIDGGPDKFHALLSYYQIPASPVLASVLPSGHAGQCIGVHNANFHTFLRQRHPHDWFILRTRSDGF